MMLLVATFQGARAMKINAYLIFDGRCEEAFRFYEGLLGGKIKAVMTFDSAPGGEKGPPDWGKKIMHVLLEVDGERIMGSDAPPPHYAEPKGISVSVNIRSVAEAERIFAALAEGGKVSMPLQQTFWAARFGMTTDRFGIPWMINCDRDA
jgi:PhnB protein